MKKLTATLLLSLGIISGVHAAVPTVNNSDWFVGFGINHDANFGSNAYNSSAITAVTGGTTADTASYNGGNVGFNAFVGKQINKNLDMRLSYNQAGTSTIKVSDGTSTNTADVKFNASSTILAAQYSVPVADNVSAGAIAGVGYYNVTQRPTTTAGTLGTLTSTDASGFAYVYGFSLGYTVNQFKVEASYITPGNNEFNSSVNLNFAYYL